MQARLIYFEVVVLMDAVRKINGKVRRDHMRKCREDLFTVATTYLVLNALLALFRRIQANVLNIRI